MIANGWATVTDDNINVRTVSPTRRGATIKWLMMVPLVPIYTDYSDARIEHEWLKHKGNAEVMPVRIIADSEAKHRSNEASRLTN